MRRIIRSAIRCNHCGDVIVSTFRHSCVQCSCGKAAVDGEADCLRRSYSCNRDVYTDLSEYADADELRKEDTHGQEQQVQLQQGRSRLKEHGLNPNKYTKTDNNKQSSGSSSSGCYLTTACVVSRGLPDNCAELQTLRAFRDSYLAALPNGKAEIEQYYQMAPGIAATIDKRNDREEIWNHVYADLVEPCVRMIHAHENEAAYQLYKTYSMELSQKYSS